jgi:hypothetical protein
MYEDVMAVMRLRYTQHVNDKVNAKNDKRAPAARANLRFRFPLQLAIDTFTMHILVITSLRSCF